MASKVSTHGGLPRALIVTRFPWEAQAVCAHLSEIHELENQTHNVYWQGMFEEGNQSWMVGVAEVRVRGPGSAREVRRAVAFFRPQLVLFVGVAKAYRQANLGDIVVSSRVFGVLTGKLGRDFYPRQEEYRPSDTLLDYIKEETEGLAWLRFVEGELSEHTPRVVVGSVAAGDVTLAVVDAPKFPLLVRATDELCAVSSSEIHFFQPAFLNNNKALLIQGIESLHGTSASPEEQQRAMVYASAFAFQILSQLAPSIIHPKNTVDLSAKHTWMAALVAILFGILSSFPLFCVRQGPYVKEVGVGTWMVSLGSRQSSREQSPFWLVTKDSPAAPVALLRLEHGYVEGFFQATPLYWNPEIGAVDNPSMWTLQPWTHVEPPESLRRHPWVLLKSRGDGSLTFPHLSPHVPRHGRAWVYLSFQRREPVGDIEFTLGPLLTIRRLSWDWRKLSDNLGPWALRLKSPTSATPDSLKKHRWPPILTIQQERSQTTLRWRFVDHVPGLLWPGSQWIVFLPDADVLYRVPFGLVQLESGEERWVKTLRMPWSSIQPYRHLVAKYFDPNREETPDLRNFGEILAPCSRPEPGSEIFGTCVDINVGQVVGGQPMSWYVVWDSRSSKTAQPLLPTRSYVRVEQISSVFSQAQAFLWKNTQPSSVNRLFLLSEPERRNHALSLCEQARVGLRKILHLSFYELQQNAWKRPHQRWEETWLVAMLLASPDIAKVDAFFPQTGTTLHTCWQDVSRLRQGIFSKLNHLHWSYRWRDVVSLTERQPQQALLLLQRLCDDAPQPQSRSMCNQRLLRLWPKVWAFLRHTQVPEDWAKRLRVELSRDACFSVQDNSMAVAKPWLDVERMLRIQDKIPYHAEYCPLKPQKKLSIPIVVMYQPPQGEWRDPKDAFLLGQYWSQRLYRILLREWNSYGLEGQPRVRWMLMPPVLRAIVGKHDTTEKKQRLRKLWMQQHLISWLWIHSLQREKQGYTLTLTSVSLHSKPSPTETNKGSKNMQAQHRSRVWKIGPLRTWAKMPTATKMKPVWQELLQLQNQGMTARKKHNEPQRMPSVPVSRPTSRLATQHGSVVPDPRPISGQKHSSQTYSGEFLKKSSTTARAEPQTQTEAISTTQPTSKRGHLRLDLSPSSRRTTETRLLPSRR